MIILPIYGTRPEAIKMAPLIRVLATSDLWTVPVAVTGQHREMLDQVNKIFKIQPDFDLDIIQPGQSLAGITSRCITGVTAILEKVKPDAVVVQGDTSTAMASALAAFYMRIPVFHVEAGLRSGDRLSPFPEEGNRKIVGQLASLHLAPTARSRDNLLREGIPSGDIVTTGNTVIDALIMTTAEEIAFSDSRLTDLVNSGRDILLVTTHRRENQGDAMQNIGKALADLSRKFSDLVIVLPVHRNPVVRDAVLPPIAGLHNVIVVEPLPYGEFTKLLRLSKVVLTDSGGVQEEAPSLGKPVLVMRDNTERPEAVEAGTVRLIGTSPARIVGEVSSLLTDTASYDSMARANNPYGDGQAAERIAAAFAEYFHLGSRLPDFSSKSALLEPPLNARLAYQVRDSIQ